MTREEYANRPNRSSKWITPVKRLAIYLRDGFSCVYCGRDLKECAPSEVHLDHLQPRSEGGSDEHTNLVTACRSCNCGRKTTAWRTYATPGAVDRIVRLRRRVLNIDLAKAIIAGRTGSQES